MIERKTISYSDDRVIKAVRECKNASRFFEEAAIFYLESLEDDRISKEMVKDIVLDCLKGMVTTAHISNPNYTNSIDEDIMTIMDMDL